MTVANDSCDERALRGEMSQRRIASRLESQTASAAFAFETRAEHGITMLAGTPELAGAVSRHTHTHIVTINRRKAAEMFLHNL